MKVTVTVSGQQPDGRSFLRIVGMNLVEHPIVMKDGREDILRQLQTPRSDLVTLVGDMNGGPDELIHIPDDGSSLRETFSRVVSILTEEGQELIQRPRGWRK